MVKFDGDEGEQPAGKFLNIVIRSERISTKILYSSNFVFSR